MMTSALALRPPPSVAPSAGSVALAAALVVPLLGSLVYFVWLPGGGVGRAAYTLTKLFTLIFPLLVVGRSGLRALTRPHAPAGTPWPSWRSVVLTGLGSGALIAGLGALLMYTPLGELVWQGAAQVNGKADALGFGEHFLLYAVFVSVIHSGLEEYYWRFFVYGQLRQRCPRWLAHGIAGVAFAAHHLVVTLQFFSVGLAVFMALCVAVGGVLWSVMYERQGTVLGAWLSHLSVDALLMGVGYQLLVG